MLLNEKMVPVENFLPGVMAVVTVTDNDSRDSLPSNVAIHYIQNAIIRLCKNANVFTKIAHLETQEGMNSYPFMFEDHICHYIIGVYNQPPAPGCEPCNVGTCGLEDDMLYLHNCPGNSILYVKYSAVPKRGVCNVPDSIYQNYYDAVVDLALSELHLLPNKPWTSGGASKMRFDKYRDRLQNVRNNLIRNKMARPTRVNAPSTVMPTR